MKIDDTNIEMRLNKLFSEYLGAVDRENWFGDRNYSDAVVDWYDDHIRRRPTRWDNFVQPIIALKILEKFIAGSQGKSLKGNLIDLGCGSGSSLQAIEARLRQSAGAPGLSLYGIDFSREGIRVAKQRTENVGYYLGDFLNYRFSEQYDFVLSLGVFEHIGQLIEGLRSVSRMLSADGLAFISVPPDEVDSISDEGFGRHVHGKQLHWRLKKTSWEDAINQSGLVIVKKLPTVEPISDWAWVLSLPNSIYANQSSYDRVLLDKYLKKLQLIHKLKRMAFSVGSIIAVRRLLGLVPDKIKLPFKTGL